jgi:hypothetical protein
MLSTYSFFFTTVLALPSASYLFLRVSYTIPSTYLFFFSAIHTSLAIGLVYPLFILTPCVPSLLLLKKDLTQPMKSCREELIPFPYAELPSLLPKSRYKNTIFSTCTHLAHYTTSVYISYSTTTCVHWEL